MQFVFVYLMGIAVAFFIFLIIDKDAVKSDDTLSSDLFIVAVIWPILGLYLVCCLLKQLRWLNIHYRRANRKNITTRTSTDEKE